MNQKKSIKTSIKKLRFRYKLFILNQKTLEEVFKIELSRLTAFIYGFIALVVVFILMSLLIFLTPIKYYLPGFSDYSLRGEMATNISKLDSLSVLAQQQTFQLQIVKNIISGDISTDSIPKQKEISVEKYKALAGKKSDKEKRFVDNLQNNIISDTQEQPLNGVAQQKFTSPMAGTIKIVKPQNQSANSLCITSNNGDVLAISNGIIVSSELTVDNLYVVITQYINGYIASYKNLSKSICIEGQKINAGDVIGNVNIKDNKPYLIFEIWQNGNSINPNTILKF